MTMTKNTLIVPLTCVIACFLFWFRPGGVDGPTVVPVPIKGKGFNHSLLSAVYEQSLGADGAVDYVKLRKNPGNLNQYLGQIAASSPKNAPHRFRRIEDRLAYYLNAYNAFVLAAVRDHCPIDNIDEEYIGGRISFVMGGEPITLTQLQSERIRPVMQRNPSVHFALFGGAKGHANLTGEAFDGAKIKRQIEAIEKRVVKNPKMVSRQGKSLILSEIFEWYKSDFVDAKSWIRRLSPQIVDGVDLVAYTPFDWSLNGHCQ